MLQFLHTCGGLCAEDIPASGNPTDLGCNKSTQKLEEEKLLMGVFVFVSTVPQSVMAVSTYRRCLASSLPFQKRFSSKNR